ncbi:MAG: hypothetical protein JWQ73_2996 [Variovorax sp.]|jgi:hypothetical protein|nr:hypothetical protein [Variovorax sp.]
MILVKTEAGQQTLKDRSVRLTPRQRSAFILCDGKRSIDDVLAAGMGISQEDLDHMVDLGLLSSLNGVDVPAMARAVSEPSPVASRAAPATGSPLPAPPAQPSVAPTMPPVAAAALMQTSPTRSRQQRYQDAYPIATRLTGALGLRGFRLNLAVEGTSTYDELAALAPKIRAAVGAEKAAELDRALEG